METCREIVNGGPCGGAVHADGLCQACWIDRDIDRDRAQDFRARCLERAARIPVRAQIGGRWGTHMLSELTPEQREERIARWWAEGREPIEMPEG